MSLLAQDERLTRRVGAIALALIGLAILFFVFVADRIEWGSHVRVRVYFGQAGGLREGAGFVVAGQRMGRVEHIALVPQGTPSPLGGASGIVVTVAIDAASARLLHVRPWPSACCAERQPGDVFVASHGLLSERYLELAAAPEGSPVMRDGDQLLGAEPPTLDRVLQRTWDNMMTMKSFGDEVGPELDALRGEIAQLRAQFAPTSGNVNALAEAAPLMGPLIDDTVGVIAEIRQLREVGLGGDAGLAKGGSVVDETRAMLRQLRTTLDVLGARAATLRAALATTQGTLASRGAELAAKLELTITRARTAIDKIDPLLAQVADIQARIARGEGSLLKLANDPEFPEEAKELGKIMKRQPWKILDRPTK